MKLWIPLTSFLLFPTYLSAATFNLNIEANNQNTTKSFENIEALFDATEEDSLKSIIPNYVSGVTAINAQLDVRGVDVISSYDESSSLLTFEIKSLGIFKQFDGGDRAKSGDLLRSYIKGNGDGVLSKLLQESAATTAIDPVAGNPDSLMGSIISADAGNATTLNKSSRSKGAEGGQADDDEFGINLSAGCSSVNGHDKCSLTLPLSYTHYFAKPEGKKEGYKLRIDAPLAYFETNGSKAYQASIGAALQIPITDNFSLTPAIRTGIVASKDLGSAANVNSVSLTSIYNTRWDKMNISFSNMVGVIQTKGLESNGVDIDYSLSNQVMKNGIAVEMPSGISLAGKKTSWEASIANTYLTGDALYISNYYDLALSLGTVKENNDSLRLGLTYTQGEHGYSKLDMNFGYKF
jgi:hypothetical protein